MTPLERLRRLVDRLDRGLRENRRVVGCTLGLLGVAVLAVLGAAAWPIVQELRTERAVAAAEIRSAYMQRVRDRLVSVTKTAVERLPQSPLSGKVGVRMVIGADGALRQLTLAGASLSPDMEAFALGIAREAAPFEPFPAAMRGTMASVELTNWFVFE